jgi:hypothetical protein
MKQPSVSSIVLFPAFGLAMAMATASAQARLIGLVLYILWLTYLFSLATFGSCLWVRIQETRSDMFCSLLWSAVCPAGAAVTSSIMLILDPYPKAVHVLVSAVGGYVAANVAFLIALYRYYRRTNAADHISE